MSGRGPEAIAAALSLLQSPRLGRLVRASPLPPGMTTLLEVAAGDQTAALQAAAATGRTEARIREAAGFFIEQILLAPKADSYRILGSSPRSTDPEIRRHMALLMRWLHPDLSAHGEQARRFDKSAFASRITTAWECLKTPERRAAYEISMRAGDHPEPTSGRSRPAAPASKGWGEDLRKDGLLSRLLVYRARW